MLIEIAVLGNREASAVVVDEEGQTRSLTQLCEQSAVSESVCPLGPGGRTWNLKTLRAHWQAQAWGLYRQG